MRWRWCFRPIQARSPRWCRLCAANQIAIVPQGGNTSLCGASVPLPQGGQIVLNLSRMNRIRDIDPANYTMTVEAGCKLADVRRRPRTKTAFFRWD